MTFILLFLSLLMACDDTPFLPADTMKKVMWDLAKADEFALNYLQRDTTVDIKKKTKELYAQVFSLHKISQEDFLKSLRFYKGQPDDMKILMDSLNAYASRMREAQFMQNTSESEDIDSTQYKDSLKSVDPRHLKDSANTMDSSQSKALPNEKTDSVPR